MKDENHLTQRRKGKPRSQEYHVLDLSAFSHLRGSTLLAKKLRPLTRAGSPKGIVRWVFLCVFA